MAPLSFLKAEEMESHPLEVTGTLAEVTACLEVLPGEADMELMEVMAQEQMSPPTPLSR